MGITYTSENDRLKILASILNPKYDANGKRIIPVLKTPNGMMTLELYPNTNENLGFIQYLNVEGCNCITTGSSCDQLFTLIANGASNVDLFDINPLAKDFFELKKQVIQHMSHKTAQVFLLCHKQNSYFLQKDLYYSKIDKHLSDFEKTFWRQVIESPNKFNLFRNDRQTLNPPFYFFNRDNFKKVRENLANCSVDFFELPLSHLGSVGRRYEIALFSNIVDWYKSPDDFLDHVCQFLPFTSSEAKIQIGYQWNDSNSHLSTELATERFGNAIVNIPHTGWWGHNTIFLDRSELTIEEVQYLFHQANENQTRIAKQQPRAKSAFPNSCNETPSGSETEQPEDPSNPENIDE